MALMQSDEAPLCSFVRHWRDYDIDRDDEFCDDPAPEVVEVQTLSTLGRVHMCPKHAAHTRAERAAQRVLAPTYG